MHNTTVQVLVTVAYSLLVLTFSAVFVYALARPNISRTERVSGCAIALLLVTLSAFGIAYVWS